MTKFNKILNCILESIENIHGKGLRQKIEFFLLNLTIHRHISPFSLHNYKHCNSLNHLYELLIHSKQWKTLEVDIFNKVTILKITNSTIFLRKLITI